MPLPFFFPPFLFFSFLFSFLFFRFLHASLFLSFRGFCLFLLARHLATRKTHKLGYVLLSDPHTGLFTLLQSSHLGQGFGVVGELQGPLYCNWRELLSFLGSAHFAMDRRQLFSYVLLFEPHTGRYLVGHFFGHDLEGFRLPHAPERNVRLQLALMNEDPHQANSLNYQNISLKPMNASEFTSCNS